MFIFDETGNNPTFNRIVKSIAIPRGETVLAQASFKHNQVVFDSDDGIVVYNLTATNDSKDKTSEYSGVLNGKFTSIYSIVPSFTQNVTIDLKNNLFTYSQASPIIKNGEETDHDNSCTLTKLNI